MVKKRRRCAARERVFQLVNGFFLCLVALATVFPLLYVLYKSLTTYSVDPMGVRRTFLDLGAYQYIFRDDSIGKAFFLTAGVVVVSTVLHVLVTMLAAYPLSKSDLKGRRVMLGFVLITMVFSGGLMPYYILIGNLNLRNNPLVYIIPGLVSGFNIIVARNFITGIPVSLEESAKIDGASDLTVFYRIVLPLSKPIICTIALWFAVAKWNDWMTGLLYVRQADLKLLQNVLRDMLISGSGMNDSLGLGTSDKFMLMENIKMAVIIVATVPILCIYPFVQKYFINGTMLGAVKE